MKKYLITVNGNQYEVEVELLEDDSQTLHSPLATPAELGYPAHHEPREHHHAADHKPVRHVAGSKEVTCPINGTIVEILVQPGQTVKDREIVATIEAMKMKTSVFSNQYGVVKTVETKVGDIVEHGQKILTFE